MQKGKKFASKAIFIAFCLGICLNSLGQRTQIRGFVEAHAQVEEGKTSFGFGEQDLFITSELTDRLSFLGESVFKFTLGTPTEFSVSVERVIIKYNYAGNHNFLIGKHHTPINYWNDTYHHGRVFFPTVERPILFAENFIPLHTTGISLQGHDLGDLKFGYDFMIGNGIGSYEIADNDKHKSVTAAIKIKPADRLQLGASYYHDVISKGADVHGKIVDWEVKQQLFTGSLAYFSNTWEVLGEATLANNRTDTTGSQNSLASYLYAGYRIKDKYIPYFRVDNLTYGDGEIYYHNDNTTMLVLGFRYQISYLAVVKLEYNYVHTKLEGDANRMIVQFAIGF